MPKKILLTDLEGNNFKRVKRNIIKLAFVGNGKSVNRYHMPFIDETKKFEVVGFYDPSVKKFEMPYPKYLKIKRYPTLEDLLKDDIDLVVVSTPAKFHYEVAMKVIDAKKHVLVEKPICDTVSQLVNLYEKASKKGVLVTPYQNRRYDSDFLTIKRQLTRNDIGVVTEIESNYVYNRPDVNSASGTVYDGTVYGHGIHFIDQIVSLFGQPDDVIYDAFNQKDFSIGTNPEIKGKYLPEDYYDIKLIYGGKRVRVRFSPVIVKAPPRWIVNSTKATIEKYYEDQQERDLKKGIYPYDLGFGKDLEGMEAKVYFGKHIDIAKPVVEHYSGYYEDLHAYLTQGDGQAIVKRVVSKEESLVVLHILETIVSKKKYSKLEIMSK